MKKNIGTRDRIIRLVIGIVLFYAVTLVDAKLIQWILFIGSLFCIFQAIVGWCALYTFMKKNTCAVSKE